MDVFHIIRKCAVPDNVAPNERAHTLLKYTCGLCVWHYLTNCNGEGSSIPTYEKPVSRKLLLEKELEEEKKRSAEL